MDFSELALNSLKSVFLPKKFFKKMPAKPEYSVRHVIIILFLFGALHEITRNIFLQAEVWLAAGRQYLLLLSPIYVGAGLILLWFFYSSVFYFIARSVGSKASLEKIRLGAFYFCAAFLAGNIFDLPHFFGVPYLTKTITYAWDIHLGTIAIVVLGTIQLHYFVKEVVGVRSRMVFFITWFFAWASALVFSGGADFIRPWPLKAAIWNYLQIDVQIRLLRFYYFVLMIFPIAFAANYFFVKGKKLLALVCIAVFLLLFYFGYLYNPFGTYSFLNPGTP
jgi:hypothetical protein